MLLRVDILLNGYGELPCFIPGSSSGRRARSMLRGLPTRAAQLAVI
jgi:hypothetical protein